MLTPSEAPAVARHFNHSERVATQHYVIVDAEAISSHIKKLQRGQFGRVNAETNEPVEDEGIIISLRNLDFFS